MDTALAIKTFAYVVTTWFVLRMLQEKMKYPEKTLFICFINVALGPLRFFNLFQSR